MLDQFGSSHLCRVAGRQIAVLVAVVLGLGMTAVGSAHAQTYRAPNTVANFCSFNSGLGRVYTGRAGGDDYAAWAVGTSYFDYFAFDTDGDTHVDEVAYAPFYGGEYHVLDVGTCAGSGSGRWYNAAAIEQQYQQEQARDRAAGNEAWSEMAPGIEFSGEMEALDDALM